MNLVEALTVEIRRVTKIAAYYRSIGPGGEIGARMMEAEIDRAQAALGLGSILPIIHCLHALEGWEPGWDGEGPPRWPQRPHTAARTPGTDVPALPVQNAGSGAPAASQGVSGGTS